MPKKRTVGKEGVGSPGDVRDRFRDAYKPGKNKTPAQPLDSLIIKGDRMVKRGAQIIKNLPYRIDGGKKKKLGK